MKFKIILAAIIVVILAGVGYAISFGTARYNQIVVQDEEVKARWGYVESAYQRRSDVIPNLVSVVEASGKFEKSTLEAVINARASATRVSLSANDLSDPTKLQAFDQAQGTLGSTLSRLLVTVEQYPDLKASNQYRDLMIQLEGTENRINTERNLYNEAVKGYNQTIRLFPTNIIASIIGAKQREAFKAVTEGAEQAPVIKFSN